MQNNIPFYDGDRLCLAEFTMLPSGEVVPFGWESRGIPSLADMTAMKQWASEAIPGATVTMKPMVDAGVNVIINDGGPTKTITMYGLANAYLGAPANARVETLKRFVRELPYDD